MSKATALRKKKEARRRVLLYIKAWLPTLIAVLILVAMAIPCFQYTYIASIEGIDQERVAISEWTLLSNTWSSSRMALFSGAYYDEAEIGFSRACFVTVLISAVLALISIGFSVWSSVGATRFLRHPQRQDKERALYLAFFNRPLLLVYQLLWLPLLAFPRIIVGFFEDLAFFPVELRLTFPEPMMIFAALMIFWLVLTLTMKRREQSMGLNPFAEPLREEEEEEEEANEKYEPQFATEEEQKIHEMQEKTREEQMEKIRRMLSREKED